MKLLTVTDNSNELVLDLDENLDIPPNSQIAVQSAAIEYQPAEYMTGFNRAPVFEYTIPAGGANRIVRPVLAKAGQTYTATDTATLLGDIQQWLNGAIGGDMTAPRPSELGSEFNVVSDTGKTSISYGLGTITDPGATAANLTGVTRTAGGRLTRTGPPAVDGTASVHLTERVASGYGINRVRINTADLTAAVGGFLLGYSEIPAPTELDQVLYGVRVEADGTAAVHRPNSATPIPGYNVNIAGAGNARNSTLSVDYYKQGQLRIVDYRGAGAAANVPNVLDTSSVSYVHLFPVVFIFGNCTLELYRVSPTAFSASTFDESDNGDSVGAPRQTPGQFNFGINFLSDSLAEFIGFEGVPSLTQLTIDKKTTFVSDVNTGASIEDETLVVQLKEFALESYDSRKRKRTGILCTAINPQAASGRLVYSFSYPAFLDLSNTHRTLSVRRLTFELLREDLSPFPVNGAASLSILLKRAIE